MRPLAWVLCAFLGCSVPRADHDPLKFPDAALEVQAVSPRHVLILGDSEACAVRILNDLPGLVRTINDEAGAPHDSVDVECQNGTTVQHWAAGHARRALQLHPNPDVIIIFLGTNHYNSSTVPPVGSLLTQLGSVPCVWVGNTQVHGRDWPINDVIRRAAVPRCTYFDTQAAKIPLVDGVHPTRAGAERWIREIWRVVP
jgi:lysophospholipase L1-like esterase